jgi:hypothetical protein
MMLLEQGLLLVSLVLVVFNFVPKKEFHFWKIELTSNDN